MRDRLGALDMGRRMGVLLTCAWVLWQMGYGGVSDSIVTTYDTKAECEQGRRQTLQALAHSPDGSWVVKDIQVS